jgi:hypothetical protein
MERPEAVINDEADGPGHRRLGRMELHLAPHEVVNAVVETATFGEETPALVVRR